MSFLDPYYREKLSNEELARRLRNSYWTNRGYFLDMAEALARLLTTQPAEQEKP